MPNTPFRVIGAEVLGGAVLVRFSDNTNALFHAHFLYKVQSEDGNVPNDQLPDAFGEFPDGSGK